VGFGRVHERPRVRAVARRARSARPSIAIAAARSTRPGTGFSRCSTEPRRPCTLRR
jgi:hypothetical protein